MISDQFFFGPINESIIEKQQCLLRKIHYDLSSPESKFFSLIVILSFGYHTRWSNIANDGCSINIDGKTYILRDIVLYSRYAALKHRCHINLEGVGSLALVKCLYKYVVKRVDMCTIEVVNDRERIIN